MSASSKGSLGNLLNARGDRGERRGVDSRESQVRRQVFGEAHTEYAWPCPASPARSKCPGPARRGEALLEQALQIARRNSATIIRRSSSRRSTWRASASRRPGRGDRSRPATRCTSAGAVPAGDWRIAQAQSLLGAALFAQKRYAEAEPLMLAADHVLKPCRAGKRANASPTAPGWRRFPRARRRR